MSAARVWSNMDARRTAATKGEQGNWYLASGGAEQPFTTRTGRRLLYCWQPSTGRHAYLDCSTDLILSDAEAQAALALN